MLKIKPERAHTPEDVEHGDPCAICGESFRLGVVAAFVTSDGTPASSACPECIAVLGAYRPDRFPTRAEYEAAVRRFDGPIWGSIEEADRDWQDGAA